MIEKKDVVGRAGRYKKRCICALVFCALLLIAGVLLTVFCRKLYVLITFLYTGSMFSLALSVTPFCRYTNWYPVNPVPREVFVAAKSKWKSGVALFTVYDEGNGVWSVDISGERKEAFDLTGYFFPKSYICSYFLRNLHYREINKRKCRLNRWFRSLKLSDRRLPERFGIRFVSEGKEKVLWLAKKRRTKVGLLRETIMEAPYVYRLHGKYISARSHSYFYINEEIYEIAKRKFR